MTIDTAGMPATECRQRMPAAPTGYDDALPEGAAIAVLLFVAALLLAAVAAVCLLNA